MTLDVYNTHMELYPYQKDDLPALELLFTSIDNFTKQEVPCGYMIADKKLYLPRGTPISKVEYMSGCDVKYHEASDPAGKMSDQFESLYEPRNDFQREAIKFLLENRNHQLALNAEVGLGKFEPYSRKIPTPTRHGWTRMGDLRVGDEVFAWDGTRTKILQIFEQGEQDIYKITFADGRIALCGLDHLWTVKTHKYGRYRTISTKVLLDRYRKSLMQYEFNSLGNSKHLFYHYIPICNQVQYPERDIPIHPYVLGAFIGNGCCREPVLSISSGDDFVPNKIATLCGFRVKRNTLRNYTYTFYDKKTGNPIHTKNFFKDVPEMISCYSSNKVIPEDYQFNNIENRLELLKGLMDTDGSINVSGGRYHTTYSSCSKSLLEQIQQILFSLGLRGNIGVDQRVEKYRNGYHGHLMFNIQNDQKPTLFSHPRKYKIALESSNVLKADKYSDLRIDKIEYVKREQARCIMVDHPDHMYLTEDFIVTHNTFMTAYCVTVLSEKAMIIVPNEGLKTQWIETFHKMFNYKPRHLMNIAGGKIIDDIMNDLIEERDVYFVNHATLRNYMTDYGGYALHKFFKKLKIGIKVYDESHLEFHNILMIDHYTNTNRTWYLTATFDRSDRSESICFKRAFSNMEAFGEYESAQIVKKHIIYHVVNFNSRPTVQQRRQVMGWRGMTAASYGKYAFINDDKEVAYNIILRVLRLINDLEGKILVFVPLIEAVDAVAQKLKKSDLGKSVGVYHSKTTGDDKKDALKKDIIVTTIQSFGTGKDLPGLRTIISCSPLSSKTQTHQLLGRLRPYAADKDTYFFDCVDVAIPACSWWHRARYKKIETIVKKTIYLNLDE